MELDTITCGDCLEGMKALPDGCVDVIIADPPYGLTFGARTIDTRAFNTLRGAGWEEEHSWLEEAARVLTDGGAWYVFMNDEGWSSLKSTAMSLGLWPCARLVWLKTNPLPAIPRKVWRRATELIMYGTKGRRTARFVTDNQRDCLPYTFAPIVGGADRSEHPTQKPVSLIAKYIGVSCPEGGTVLDPFMGSGTTAVACIETGRHFVGFEISPDYCAIAERRIEKARRAFQPELSLAAN